MGILVAAWTWMCVAKQEEQEDKVPQRTRRSRCRDIISYIYSFLVKNMIFYFLACRIEHFSIVLSLRVKIMFPFVSLQQSGVLVDYRMVVD